MCARFPSFHSNIRPVVAAEQRLRPLQPTQRSGDALADGLDLSVLLASAALDRLTHRSRTVVIEAQSYRQRARRQEAAAPPSEAPQAGGQHAGNPVA
jgi:hypothetical protein